MPSIVPGGDQRGVAKTMRSLRYSWLLWTLAGLLALGVTLQFVFRALRQPHQMVYVVSVVRTAREVLPTPLRIYADGREIGTSRERTFETEVSGHPYYGDSRPDFEKDLPALTGEMLVPCGWRKVNLFVHPATGKKPWDKMSGVELERLTRTFEVYPTRTDITMIRFWIDNRGEKETPVSVGQLEVKIPADTSGKFDLPAPDCSEDVVVRVDGKDAGIIPRNVLSLPARRSDSPGPVPQRSKQFLLDPSGKRCYRLSEKHYEDPGVIPAIPWRPTETSVGFAGKRLYQLPGVEPQYFLEAAPETIHVKDEAFTAVRWQLLETNCSRRP